MRIIDFKAAAEKVSRAVPTIYEWVRENGPPDRPFPKPVARGGRGRGFIEDEVDAWIAASIAERDAATPKPPLAPWRKKFWDEVRSGKRLHPRIAGRMRRGQKAAA